MTTIETRLKLTAKEQAEIDQCVVDWSQGYRMAWSRLNTKKEAEIDVKHHLNTTNRWTAYQVGSMIQMVRGETRKTRALTKTQLTQQTEKLKKVIETIEKLETNQKMAKSVLSQLKQAKTKKYATIGLQIKRMEKLEAALENKRAQAKRLAQAIATFEKRIEENTYAVCFGSKKLLGQRPGGHKQTTYATTQAQKPYNSLDDWRKDWELARNNTWYSVGDKSKPFGNGEIQYDPMRATVRLRLNETVADKKLVELAHAQNLSLQDVQSKIKYSPLRMAARFMEIENVHFTTKQVKLIQANAGLPISARIMKRKAPDGKHIGYYLQLILSEDIPEVHTVEQNLRIMGLDLNAKGLAYAVVKKDGNKFKSNDKTVGFLKWDLQDKTTNQRKWIISNALTEVLAKAKSMNVSHIAIENLDFSDALSGMRHSFTTQTGRQYNKMLSSFPTAQFKEMLLRKAERLGLHVCFVNPAYSSVGGFAKYGMVNKVPVDIAASIWLARQAHFGTIHTTKENISFIKKHHESPSLPYHARQKQCKMTTRGGRATQWSEVKTQLTFDRRLWPQKLWSSAKGQTPVSHPFEDVPL